ncbi:GntR family transcriptional regulator [Marinomonas sp. GJ51-6]|uniref:GntR family transcriptional regulator n=1 Tax=Marinomonas sp. GJ51-6 TaxID=2992802 RepID=UPI002934C88C|nr:GntR family transcriptional regulator [Marinomonas sp. GJ51-6]WOD08248.1 GntR family transcriptional regulator [Marinomonas sp. GJ51-6]
MSSTLSLLEHLFSNLPDNSLPIYAKLKQAISLKISSGEWKANQRVPSEAEIVNALGMSRMTVNRALRELTAEGFLVRQQGLGTFVAEKKHTQPYLKCITSRKRLRFEAINTIQSYWY